MEKSVTIELEHYVNVKRAGNWSIPDGVSKGTDVVKGALELAHATYMGFHGEPGDYLRDNPKLVREVANILGYRYFPSEITIHQIVEGQEVLKLGMKWKKKGVAPAYQKFELQYRIVAEDGIAVAENVFKESDNLTWLPNATQQEEYNFQIPVNFPAGSYKFQIRLHDPLTDRLVLIGLKDEVLTKDNYYEIAKILIE